MAGPVPAMTILKSAAPQIIGITGTRPVMTKAVSFRPDTQEQDDEPNALSNQPRTSKAMSTFTSDALEIHQETELS
jgi:hypothetical protein